MGSIHIKLKPTPFKTWLRLPLLQNKTCWLKEWKGWATQLSKGKMHKNLIRMYVNQIISFYDYSDRRTSFSCIIFYTINNNNLYVFLRKIIVFVYLIRIILQNLFKLNFFLFLQSHQYKYWLFKIIYIHTYMHACKYIYIYIYSHYKIIILT